MLKDDKYPISNIIYLEFNDTLLVSGIKIHQINLFNNKITFVDNKSNNINFWKKYKFLYNYFWRLQDSNYYLQLQEQYHIKKNIKIAQSMNLK